MSDRSDMHIFTGHGDEFVIFARSREKAEAIFETVVRPDHVMPPGFGGHEIYHWRLFGNEKSIEQITRNGWEGVGIPLTDRGIWTVLPVWKEVTL